MTSDGDFHRVLRAAIERSGLGLERIRYHLSQRGCRVSVATLSHWQSGRRRPERQESLHAVAVLEEVLAVPAGALAAVLGPPRSRGPRQQRRVAADVVWPGEPQVPPLLGEVDGEDEFLVRLSHQDVVRMGADGAEVSMLVRLVLRAARSGVSRLPVVSVLDGPHPTGQWVRPVRHCAVGETRYLPEFGSLVASLVFDRELDRGEVIMVEYEVVNPVGAPPSVRAERKLRFPVREYFVEVGFAAELVPARCRWRIVDGSGVARGGGLRLDKANTAQFAVSGAEPGTYAVHWDW
ncbi:XRE family transcriptional regulator [Actinokineospora diospyrosa]|uniref:XRE family transcriptional regulator n=1 Tax=Actinokineospora diospyrosa TaxID=103728 RepID=A0ABT1IBK9_9PSEU|nr:XRE family transcriptional regulator [Actinokineospora diospyrosa]MCP2270015.1 hypothetical protein [Actinokineospora diospyrosa]